MRRTSNLSITTHIQKYIGTAYDVVKTVADNLSFIIRSVFTYNTVVIVDASHYSEGNTVIPVEQGYVTNNSSIMVFVNGEKVFNVALGSGGRYEETDANTITFLGEQLPLGSEVDIIAGNFVDNTSFNLGTIDGHSDVSTAGMQVGQILELNNKGILVPGDKTEVLDTLGSNETNVALSANQGRVLNLEKVSTSSIVDNLNSTSATSPLSANQGRVLKSLIDSLETPNINWDLTVIPSPESRDLTPADGEKHFFTNFTSATVSEFTMTSESTNPWETNDSIRFTVVGDNTVRILPAAGVSFYSAEGYNAPVVIDRAGESVTLLRLAPDVWFLDKDIESLDTLSTVLNDCK